MKLEVGSRCLVKDLKPKCISRSFCLASFGFWSLSFVFFMVLFLIVSFVYLLAFTRNHKTFLSPFFLLKFFEKTTKIFLRSFWFFFASLSVTSLLKLWKSCIFACLFALLFAFFEKTQKIQKYFSGVSLSSLPFIFQKIQKKISFIFLLFFVVCFWLFLLAFLAVSLCCFFRLCV